MIAVKAVMYHYVRPPDASLPHLRHLHIDDFRRQLDFFANEYGFLAKEEFIASVKSGVSPRPGVVLTFDDGLKDHYRYVLPELEQRDLWGISYIPTSPYLTHELLDVHRIHMLLAKHGGKEIFQSIHTMLSEDMLSHRHIAEFRTETYKTQNNDEYTNHVKRTLNYYINYNHRKGVIDELMAIYYPDETILVQEFYMTRDEICRMHNAGMIIGSHTVNHPVMSKLSVDEQRKEIELSFRFIEKIIGKIGLKTFCYPYGGFHSFTDATERLLSDYGCLFSFNVEPRDISQRDLLNRRQALPRFDCNAFPFGVCQK